MKPAPFDYVRPRTLDEAVQALAGRPEAKVLAEARGIACVEVDYDALRGIEKDTLTLF